MVEVPQPSHTWKSKKNGWKAFQTVRDPIVNGQCLSRAFIIDSTCRIMNAQGNRKVQSHFAFDQSQD